MKILNNSALLGNLEEKGAGGGNFIGKLINTDLINRWVFFYKS